MPATISSAGTWTTIRTATTGQGGANQSNDPHLLNLNPLDLTGGSAQGMGVIPEELLQFLHLAAGQWGLSFWPTVTYINALLQALQTRGAPSQLSPV
jgi:hypothetical protein